MWAIGFTGRKNANLPIFQLIWEMFIILQFQYVAKPSVTKLLIVSISRLKILTTMNGQIQAVF